jgi:hypothetical protein
MRKRRALGSPAAEALVDLLLREPEAGAGIAEGLALLLGLLALGVQLLGGAEAAVGPAGGEQLLGALVVAGEALALQERPLVPDHADPRQGGLDLAGHGLVGALLVGVLDAQDENAAHVLTQQVVVDGRAGPAHVQEAGGRRSETDPDGSLNLDAHDVWSPLGGLSSRGGGTEGVKVSQPLLPTPQDPHHPGPLLPSPPTPSPGEEGEQQERSNRVPLSRGRCRERGQG